MSLKDKITSFPKTPGVYLMKDKEGNIIYVGKSKKLQDRIKSYFINSKSHSRKVQRMVKGIYDIEIIKTDTELDALLLECEYIKSIRPIYNKLMKNHENYSYIKIDKRKQYPYLEVVNDIDDESIYFGPYAKESKLEEIKEILNDTYKLRRCKKMNKCFNYDLNKCIGPCRDSVLSKEYKDVVYKLINDIDNDGKHTFNILNENMKSEINSLNFERASIIKNNIDKLKGLFNKQEVISESLKNIITIAWIELDEEFYKVYIIRSGKLVKSQIVEKKLFDNLNKNEYIKDNVGKKEEKDKDASVIDKYDIDFINIIYSYIKYNKEIKSISIEI